VLLGVQKQLLERLYQHHLVDEEYLQKVSAVFCFRTNQSRWY
jgi:hypothetical protein